ncbi:hypothetical protein FB446DRAFT_708798 [Lentinula raphanica]|nr:hypothetical protein FB446DRAFT_708798 [Lentinula raphanica]
MLPSELFFADDDEIKKVLDNFTQLNEADDVMKLLQGMKNKYLDPYNQQLFTRLQDMKGEFQSIEADKKPSAACSSSNVEVRNQTSRTSVKPKELRKSGSSSSSFPLSSAFSSAVEDFLVVSGVYSKSSVLGTEEAVVAEVVSFCVIGRISGGSLFGNAGLDVLSNACVQGQHSPLTLNVERRINQNEFSGKMHAAPTASILQYSSYSRLPIVYQDSDMIRRSWLAHIIKVQKAHRIAQLFRQVEDLQQNSILKDGQLKNVTEEELDELMIRVSTESTATHGNDDDKNKTAVQAERLRARVAELEAKLRDDLQETKRNVASVASLENESPEDRPGIVELKYLKHTKKSDALAVSLENKVVSCERAGIAEFKDLQDTKKNMASSATLEDKSAEERASSGELPALPGTKKEVAPLKSKSVIHMLLTGIVQGLFPERGSNDYKYSIPAGDCGYVGDTSDASTTETNSFK